MLYPRPAQPRRGRDRDMAIRDRDTGIARLRRDRDMDIRDRDETETAKEFYIFVCVFFSPVEFALTILGYSYSGLSL